MSIDTLTVVNVSKRFGLHRALSKVDLTVNAGQPCALLGGNGAGKSTLLGIMSTLVTPSTGQLTYSAAGKPVAAGAELRAQIGVLAHNSFIYGELTGWENLQFYARLYGLDSIDERARALLDEVELGEEARGRIANTYSRGMLQRLALARTLLHDPHVLLLDEPFTGLDRAGVGALARSLARAKAADRIVIVVTHDLESIADLAGQVAVLRRGKLVCDEHREKPFSHAELVEIYHRYTE